MLCILNDNIVVEYVGIIMQSQLGGKLLVFQSTLPSLGIGRLKLRGDDPRIYGTEKEHQLRVTEEQFYKHMAADFSKYQIGVNIYAFAERYTDLASLGKPLGWAVLSYSSFSQGTQVKGRHRICFVLEVVEFFCWYIDIFVVLIKCCCYGIWKQIIGAL